MKHQNLAVLEKKLSKQARKSFPKIRKKEVLEYSMLGELTGFDFNADLEAYLS